MADIVERLKFDAVRCELHFSKGVAGNIEEAATELQRLRDENAGLRAALDAVAGFGSVNLAGEYEHGLRDIIRSMTDCARRALEQTG